jgi:hypothetical protein
LAAEVSEDQVASWYRRSDLVPQLDESVFDADIDEQAALEHVLQDVGWSTPGDGSGADDVGPERS